MRTTEYAVIVAGGGPAGIAAAIATGRAGARTLLIEKNAYFGGTWTAGGMSLIIDYDNKAGLMAEIKDKLTARGAFERWHNINGLFTVEPMKLLLDELLTQAGVELRLHTLVIGARNDNHHITELETASKSGIERFSAKVYIDATGDGDLAARAGCGYDWGDPATGKLQPGTMFGLVGGWPEPLPDALDVKRTLLEGGHNLSYTGVTLFAQPGQPGLAFLMQSHLYNLDPTDADSLTRAELEGRRDVQHAVETLRASGKPEYANLFLISSGPSASIREGRRIHGLYTLTAGDCRSGRRFEDAVCTATFNVDVHHTDPQSEMPYQAYGRPNRILKNVKGELYAEWVPPYDIPYRCLVARDVDNLLTSGRCISGDFLAHSSYRVTGNAVPIGEAAGGAAALCAEKGMRPSEVTAAQVKRVATGMASK